jgi:hypothetical protein
MIEILGIVGLLAFAATSIAIGFRLLLLGRRTRGVPELTIGSGFVVGCLFGYIPETIVLSTDLLPVKFESLILSVTQVAIRLAAISILVFTTLVFRAESAWAKKFAGVIVLVLIVSWFEFRFTRVFASNSRDLFWYDCFAFARSIAIAWGATESFAYYARLRRRLRLGLADPLVANRFLLWGVGMTSMTALMASTLLASVLSVDPASASWVLFESFAGLVGASTLWLTFFPTRAYRRFVESRAAGAAAG